MANKFSQGTVVGAGMVISGVDADTASVPESAPAPAPAPTVYTYAITGATDDPTTSEWRDNYAPAGYTWVADQGFTSDEPLTDTSGMFEAVDMDEIDVTYLNMSEVIMAARMFRNASGMGVDWTPSDLTEWNVSKVRDFSEMFRDTSFDQDISGWAITTDASTPIQTVMGPDWTHYDVLIDGDTQSYWEIFSTSIQDDLGDAAASHDGTGVNMKGMFEGNDNFNQDIGSWDTSEVFIMSDMFTGASSFNGNIGSWNTSKVKSTYGLFYGAGSFDQDISGWDVSSVVNMSWMFEDATSFNSPIGSWNVSSAVRFKGMFHGATSFNSPIGSWNTSSCINMDEMFEEAESFDQDIGAWDVSNVVEMTEMFQDASAFNNGGSPSIANWDTSSVEDMEEMFENADSFTQDISGWDVSNVSENYQFDNNVEGNFASPF